MSKISSKTSWKAGWMKVRKKGACLRYSKFAIILNEPV